MSQLLSEVFEDSIDLPIGLVHAAGEFDEGDFASYPFPPLRSANDLEVRTFQTVVLENAYLKVTILPDLGGRIISLLDKRTDTEILKRHSSCDIQPSGPRGASIREGVQIALGREDRLNALGSVGVQFEHSSSEGGDTAVWLSEIYTGTGLSFHLRIALPSDRAALEIEARVLNRWFGPQRYNGGLKVYVGDGSLFNPFFASTERPIGLTWSSPDLFEGTTLLDGFLYLNRFVSDQWLAPRQVDTWHLTLAPISGMDRVHAANPKGALSLIDETLRIQTTEQRLGHKVFLQQPDGQTLEAPIDLYPEQISELNLAGLNPVAIVIRDSAKQEILRADDVNPSPLSQIEPKEAATTADLQLSVDSPIQELQRALFNVSTRYQAHILLGMKSLAAKDLDSASHHLEQALLYNADDPLTWWIKALNLRLMDTDPQAELLNAHYLAPMEPALRAESFLSQPINLDRDPNPLLKSMASNPPEFVEVACLLMEAGLFDQASRWIDEALRHVDLPILRYLMAYSLLVATKLDMEAAEQIRLASQIPFGPPYPVRPFEQKVLSVLSSRFPSDARLRAYVELWNRVRATG